MRAGQACQALSSDQVRGQGRKGLQGNSCGACAEVSGLSLQEIGQLSAEGSMSGLWVRGHTLAACRHADKWVGDSGACEEPKWSLSRAKVKGVPQLPRSPNWSTRLY